MKLPSPHDMHAGCVWLPRIIAKARLIKTGELPAEYVARFCHPGGVDDQFLQHFKLTKDEIVAVAELDDGQVANWFLARSQSSSSEIAVWNHVAVNLGRTGFPLAERFPIALATTYRHLQSRGVTTVFEALAADEAT